MTKRVKKNEKRDQVIDNEAEPLPLMKMKLSWKLQKNRETIEILHYTNFMSKKIT